MNMKIFSAILALFAISCLSIVSAAPAEVTHYNFVSHKSAEECAPLIKQGLCTDDTTKSSCTCATPVPQWAGVPNLYVEGEGGQNFGGERVCSSTFKLIELEHKSPYVCMDSYDYHPGQEGHAICRCFDLTPQE